MRENSPSDYRMLARKDFASSFVSFRCSVVNVRDGLCSHLHGALSFLAKRMSMGRSGHTSNFDFVGNHEKASQKNEVRIYAVATLLIYQTTD